MLPDRVSNPGPLTYESGTGGEGMEVHGIEAHCILGAVYT